MSDSEGFMELLEGLRARYRSAPGLTKNEIQVLVGSINLAETIYKGFESGGYRSDSGIEPPLSRGECRDLMGVILAFAKERRGGATHPFDIELGEGTRRIAFSMHVLHPLMSGFTGSVAFVFPSRADVDRARRYWTYKLSEADTVFLTWEEATQDQLRGRAVLGDTDLSRVDPERREAVRASIARVKGMGVNLVLLTSKGEPQSPSASASASSSRPAPRPPSSGCAVVFVVMLASAAFLRFLGG